LYWLRKTGKIILKTKSHDKSTSIDPLTRKAIVLLLQAAIGVSHISQKTGLPRGDEPARIAHFERWCPLGWRKDIWMKMIKKPNYKTKSK
jgi:hypothetical protein